MACDTWIELIKRVVPSTTARTTWWLNGMTVSCSAYQTNRCVVEIYHNYDHNEVYQILVTQHTAVEMPSHQFRWIDPEMIDVVIDNANAYKPQHAWLDVVEETGKVTGETYDITDLGIFLDTMVRILANETVTPFAIVSDTMFCKMINFRG